MATVDANTAAAIKRRMGKKSVRFGHLGDALDVGDTGRRVGGPPGSTMAQRARHQGMRAAGTLAVVGLDPAAPPDVVDSVEAALQAGPPRLAVTASDAGLEESLGALHARRRWLLSQDLAGDDALRDEWLSVVGELDRTTRKMLGVNERGGDASQQSPNRVRKQQQQQQPPQLAQRRPPRRGKAGGGGATGSLSFSLSQYLSGTRSASETETWEDDFLGTRVMSPPDVDEIRGFGLDNHGSRSRVMTEM